MSSFRLIIASLTHHWRANTAVALGVAVATAVLAGALMVGDSMRASLRDLVLDRLGRIDHVLVAERFFRDSLADEIARCPGFDTHFSQARPAILLPATVARRDRRDPGRLRRASRVGVLGTGPWFWQWGRGIRPERLPGAGEVVLNQPLANALKAEVGDEVLVRLPRPGSIPADSPLGRKTETVQTRRLEVVGIVPAKGLGRFDLRFHQQPPYNVFMAIDTLQSILVQPRRVNAIFVAGKSVPTAAPPAASRVLAAGLNPALADYGLSLKRIRRRFQGEVVIDYFNLTSNRMILPRCVTRAAERAFADAGPQMALTYLANDILADGGTGKIPYSTVTGIDSTGPLGPLDLDVDGKPIGPLASDEIVLNRWAADDMKAQGATLRCGDPVTLTYFEPESIEGSIREAQATFRLKAIAPLAEPGGRPRPTTDPDLTPAVAGVTDEKSITDWNPPFPFDAARVRSTPPTTQDEDYWDAYRTTPKAFLSLSAARRLWSSRFGAATSVRVAAGVGRTVADLSAKLQQELDPAELGLAFRPVKRLGLKAARGTTPFEWLLLGFSMFLVGASIMLVVLLFRLGLGRRTGELGVLLAVGLGRSRTRRLLCAEAAIVAAIGGGIGIGGGGVFAAAMLAALQSPRWWFAAINARFLRLAAEPKSLLLGYATSVVVCVVVIAWTVRRTGGLPVRRLLAGQAELPAGAAWRTRSRPARAVPVALLLLALAVGLAAMWRGGQVQAAAFFVSGALVLGGALALVWNRLRTEPPQPLVAGGGWALARLAWRNGARHPGQSSLTIGLVAAASFLIVATSAFRLDPSPEGAGDFDVYAETDMPVHQNPGTPTGRADLGLSAAQQRLLAATEVIALRVEQGDDASCLNLYQTYQPRVLGVPKSLVERGGFRWASSAAETAAQRANPWLLLENELDSAVPVVMDHDTALYALHLWQGVGERLQLRDGRGRSVTLQVVGLLSHSILQGDLLIAETAFTRLFPDASGYRLFLIDTGGRRPGAMVDLLDDRFGDMGFHAVTAGARLERLLAVQNTYLSAFQSLGALGLVLGTFGLATVQLQNMLARRGELALMRATGFRRRRLAQLIMLENVFLLLEGLVIGVLAALVAVLPRGLLGGASVPWSLLTAMLALVLVAGVAAGLITVRAVLRAPLLVALRGP